MHNQIAISYNNESYSLNVGGWANYLHSNPKDADQLVYTDDIILPSGETAGDYKKARKAEHDSAASSSKVKAHLNQSSINDFGCEWDTLIQNHKNLIHDSCFPLLFINRKRTIEEQLLINKAASNGHISAMFWIGTALSDGLNENCLYWLSRAHNRGHVGAAYEIASFLFNQTKNSRKNSEVDTSKTTPEDNPFSSILKTGEAPKLGAKAQGKVLYEIAQHSEDKQLYFRIAGQSGGAGLHSKHWVRLNDLFQLIESQGDHPWKSQVYKYLYSSGSANNQGFCASIVRDLGLAQKSESSIYLHVLGDEYQQLKAELLALADKKTK